MNERLMKPPHTSTSLENLVKIGLVDSEIMVREFGQLKKNRVKTKAQHSPFGRQAEPAK